MSPLSVCPAPSLPHISSPTEGLISACWNGGLPFQTASFVLHLAAFLPSPCSPFTALPLAFSRLNPCRVHWVLLSSPGWREWNCRNPFSYSLVQKMSTHRHFNSLSQAVSLNQSWYIQLLGEARQETLWGRRAGESVGTVAD